MLVPSILAKFDYKTSNIRRHQTKKRNGSYGKSKEEDHLREILVSIFGQDDVEPHAPLNGWDIDFYVRSLNTYIQYDGQYYHGLDRPLEAIRQHKTITDKMIHRTFIRDSYQDHWCVQNNVKLVRISGYELKEAIKINSFERIKEKVETYG